MNKPIYAKKQLIIETVDGRSFEIDLNKYADCPFGYDHKPATHPWYMQKILAIATGGYSDPDRTTDDVYHHIPPAQIKGVAVRFVPAEPVLLNIVD